MKENRLKEKEIRVMCWMVWLIVVVMSMLSHPSLISVQETPLLLGVVSHKEEESGPLFPWQPKYRFKKWALARYKKWKAAHQRAKRAAYLARLALTGVLSLAQVLDLLIQSQVRYKLGGLPVLYALLETLEVRKIINRHCPDRREVAHGTVALVLVMNRLMYPQPLYQIADWVSQTMLVGMLGIEASKFNDDRLGRTLDALYPHLEKIWLDIVETARQKADIDLSVIYYDVSAFIGHGRYAESELMDFGFAHNTPSNKRKFKLGLNVSADGNLPWLYHLWPGRTADQTTVEQNLENLTAWLKQHGRRLSESLIIGDRAMLNAEIALLYEQHGLRHLTGLRATTTEVKTQLSYWSDEQMEAHPIVDGPKPHYWGRRCAITLTHKGKSVTLKGLVIVAGPLRDQLRQERSAKIDALFAQLQQLRLDIGQPRFKTLKAIQRRVNARLRDSKVAKFVLVSVLEDPSGKIDIHWQLNHQALAQAERVDGRYLLVTNDVSLSPREMFQLYRDKDGVETCFHICKSDLNLSPLYLHQDKRISSMIMLNMIALLVYNLLQRQLRQQGLHLTTRQLIKRLEPLTVVDTHCWDGSSLRRLADVDSEILDFLNLALFAIDDLLLNLITLEYSALLDHRQPCFPLPDSSSKLPG